MTFHLLAVNLACAGPLLCIGLHRRGGRDSLRDRLGRALAWSSPAALFLGLVTGGMLVLAAPSAGLLEALARFPVRAYWMAGTELIFSLVCLLVYALSWKRLSRRPWLHALVSLLGTSNLLYHFPPLMVVLGKLSVDPTWSESAQIDRPVFLELMARGEVLSLTMHFGLASIAVASVGVLLLISRSKSDDLEQPSAKQIARGAATIALLASLLQVPVGVWVLATVSTAERNALLGHDTLSSLLFVCGLLLTFLLMRRLAGIAMGEVDSASLRRAGWLLATLVLLMTATLRSSREDSAATKTAAENSPLRLVLNSGLSTLSLCPAWRGLRPAWGVPSSDPPRIRRGFSLAGSARQRSDFFRPWDHCAFPQLASRRQ